MPDSTTCAVEDCENNSVSKGYCPKHYARLKRHGDPLATKSRPRSSPGTRSICEVDGCEIRVKGQGYCLKHYQRFKKTGDPLRNPSGRTTRTYAPDELCSADGCGDAPRKSGLCGKHYQRLANHGDVSIVLHREGCMVVGCARKHFGQGYCAKHHYRFTATGNPDQVPSGRIPPGTNPFCVVGSCLRKPRGGGGLCTTHAQNKKATGDPLVTPGPRVRSRPCAQCGDLIEFKKLPPGGKRLTSSRRVCNKCRRDTNLRRHVPALLERDGTSCNICQKQIDLTLVWPDLMSRSVDHVIPRALGGADDMSNYALVHLVCNLRKHARLEAPSAP